MTSLLVTLVSLAACGASPSSTPYRVEPRFQVGQEVVYEGRIRDSYVAEGAESESDRRLTIRSLVMDKSAGGVAKIGCCTILREPNVAEKQKFNQFEDAIAMRFAMVRLDTKGHATWADDNVEIGPPVVDSMISELGFFLESPDKLVKVGDKWVLRHTGQPNIRVEVMGPETVMLTRCLKVHLQQESHNWANDVVSLPAWSIDETVWYDEKTQTVFKVDRVVEFRDPQTPGVEHKQYVTYEQASNVKFHGSVLQNQIEDLNAAYKAQKDLDQALTHSDTTRTRLLLALKQDLKQSMQKLYSSPYRPAIQRMYKTVEAAESATIEADDEPAPVLGGNRRLARVGQRAPNFVLHSIDTGKKISRTTFHGQPVLMVFIDPESQLSIDALQTSLRAALTLNGDAKPIRILAVCPKMDGEGEKKLRDAVHGDFDVCTGAGADGAYGIDGMPHVVFIDGAGTLRMNQKGYGPELYGSLVRDISELPTTNLADEKSKGPSFLR